MTRALLIALALATVSCAPRLMKLPSGPGAPAPDAAHALADASKDCREIRSLSAAVSVSGKVNGERLRGKLLVGVATPASARIEATAPFGAPVFILVANQNDATLYIPRGDRVLEHARTDQVVEALTGVPLSAEELLPALTACWAADARLVKAVQHGPDWREVFVEPDHVLHLHRDGASAPWRVVAALRNLEHSGRRWLAEYRDVTNGLPRAVRIVSADAESHGTYDLTLSLSQVALNESLGADVFRVAIPRSADPITLDELKRARPGVREN